jgi:hypothetical protein
MRSKTLNLGVPPTTFPFAELVKQENVTGTPTDATDAHWISAPA